MANVLITGWLGELPGIQYQGSFGQPSRTQCKFEPLVLYVSFGITDNRLLNGLYCDVSSFTFRRYGLTRCIIACSALVRDTGGKDW
jgi:hypothetical protein